MAIPDFQSIMLPLLELADDKQEHTLSETIDSLAKRFNLTDRDRQELLTSGKQTRFDNRVAWALTHLAKAELLKRTGRGRFQITARGLEALTKKPDRITLTYLSRYPEFVTFRSVTRKADKDDTDTQIADEAALQTPEEALESSYQDVRSKTAQELLERIKGSSAAFFERLVVDLLVAIGYGGSRKDAGQAIGQTGDGGIDGIIKEDLLGLDAIYIQAKKWDGTVGRPVVQAFAGSLEGQRARKGILITTSQFSRDAHIYVDRIEKKIVLIDGEQLAQLMIDHGVGVTEVATYQVKKVDLDYFNDAV